MLSCTFCDSTPFFEALLFIIILIHWQIWHIVSQSLTLQKYTKKLNWQYFLYKTPYIFSFEFPKFSILLQKILKSFSENSQKCNKKSPIVRLFIICNTLICRTILLCVKLGDFLCSMCVECASNTKHIPNISLIWLKDDYCKAMYLFPFHCYLVVRVPFR